MVTPQRTLEQLIGDVAASRAALVRVSAWLYEQRVSWEASVADSIVREYALAEQVKEDEAALRAATLEAYRETGNKKPHEGVAVRIITKLNYEPEEAVAWAMQHRHTDLLALNKSAFEAVARVLKLDFVDIEEEPQATISTTLAVTE